MGSIGIVGWNGKHNFGDDVMLAVLINVLSKIVSDDLEFKVWADKKLMPSYSGILNVEPNIKSIPKLDLIMNIPLIRRYITSLFLYPMFFRNIDALIIGGGKLFVSTIGCKNFLKLIGLARRRNPGLRVVGYGLSVGPFNSDSHRDAFKTLADNIDYLLLRDVRSYETVCKLVADKSKVMHAADPALYYGKLYPHDSEKTRSPCRSGVLGISLRRGFESKSFLTSIVSLAQKWMNRDSSNRIVFFNFCTLKSTKHNDAPLSRQVVEMFSLSYRNRISTVSYSGDLRVFSDEFSSCEYVIAVRLHAAVMSYVFNTPFVLISYDEKCTDFANEIGLSERASINYESIEKESLILDAALDYLIGLSSRKEACYEQLIDSKVSDFYETLKIMFSKPTESLIECV